MKGAVDNMSSRENLSFKEVAAKFGASSLIVLGALGLTACGDNAGAEPQPTATEQTTEAPKPTPTETTTPSETQAPVSEVPKTRENWVVNEAALINLFKVKQGLATGDYETLRAEACNEFFANNPLNGDFGTPDRRDSISDVESRFEARQQLFLDYVSDKYREDRWRTDVDASHLIGGVRLCVNNGVEVTGSTNSVYGDAVIDDKPLPTVTTEQLEYPFADTDLMSFDRASYVTTTVEGQAPKTVWRRHLWSDVAQDWYITNEQTESFRDYGWK